MSKEVIEVIYGKHLRYDIVRSTSFFDTKYYVRTSDGRMHGLFSGLDRAVQWAHEQARKR
jgi:hypothetical protein